MSDIPVETVKRLKNSLLGEIQTASVKLSNISSDILDVAEQLKRLDPDIDVSELSELYQLYVFVTERFLIAQEKLIQPKEKPALMRVK